ncbi:solute carrier family 53 member 1 [Planococcus citri]|uniref:solute carrier family 53 member 1 n=1 Tax=Planococcus citri TaxID=170843 RepID=UPI0031F90119
MKFAEHLSAHITPEWRKQYINYEEMKAMLYNAVSEADMEDLDEEERRKKFAQFDDYFFRYCDAELKKINIFFSEKLAEAIRKFSTLKNELVTPTGPPGKKSESKRDVAAYPYSERLPIPSRKLQDLKLAFAEFYLSLVLLQNYQSLNFTGFRKILKKHDKLLQTADGAQWRVQYVDNSTFYTNNDITRIISETEHLYTVYLEHGDRQKAMKRLRVPPLGEQRSPWITFKVGLFSGSFIVLSVTVILSAIFHENQDQQFCDIFRLYRAPLLLMQFMFLIGVNVYGWRSSGVNHVLIFELDPRNHLSEQHLMELAAILGVTWALSILSFLYSSYISIPAYLSPLVLIFLILGFIFNPFRTFHYDARVWLVKLIGRIIAAPFFHVGFADFWLADQMNSMSTIFTDLHYTFCFYLTHFKWLSGEGHVSNHNIDFPISRTIVSFVPAWVRFAQCLRRYRDSGETLHLINAGKYASSIAAAISLSVMNAHKSSYSGPTENPYVYLYFVCASLSSVYTYTWDIKMDWGLLTYSENAENKFLREEIVYSSPTWYYLAIVEDFILRFIWIITFMLSETGFVTSEVITSITAPLEIFRRFVWNFFRLENEHLNNCGKFRAVRDICIAPIAPSDPLEVIRMMDEEDGVTNRSRRRPLPAYLKKNNIKDDKKPIIQEDLSNMDVNLCM